MLHVFSPILLLLLLLHIFLVYIGNNHRISLFFSVYFCYRTHTVRPVDETTVNLRVV